VSSVSNSGFLQKHFWKNAKFDEAKNVPELDKEASVLNVREAQA